MDEIQITGGRSQEVSVKSVRVEDGEDMGDVGRKEF